MKEVALKARAGDDEAADELFRLMSRGSEDVEHFRPKRRILRVEYP